MAKIYTCQRCSQLPPPPSILSIGPPPTILSINVRCSSRLLSSSIQHEKVTSLPSPSVSIALGIVIALLISTGTIILIKNRMIKRQQGRRRKCDDSMMVTSSSIKFNGYNNNHHHHHQNSTNLIPLLSDSCSSDHMSSTPVSEYPCGIIEPLLTNDLPHEYEQIKYDDSLNNYCLVYCRQCANYHQTSSSMSVCRRPCYLPLSTNSTCTCHLQNDNRLFECQPMLITRTDDDNDLNHQPSI